MNNHIKELAKQAGISQQYIDDYFGPKLLEQFAELIIKKCVKIAEEVTALNNKNVYQYPVADSIKIQFGVDND